MVDNNNNPSNPVYKLLDVDVLKVAHHGSDGSSSLKFLQAVNPKWAVIQAGRPHDHPHTGTIDWLKHQSVGLTDNTILRTDNDDGEDKETEKTLGDDSIVFTLVPDGIVSIEKFNIDLSKE
jgi:beta-lactamase superfamily II metal-dependent hydrolase